MVLSERGGGIFSALTVILFLSQFRYSSPPKKYLSQLNFYKKENHSMLKIKYMTYYFFVW